MFLAIQAISESAFLLRVGIIKEKVQPYSYEKIRDLMKGVGRVESYECGLKKSSQPNDFSLFTLFPAVNNRK